MVNAIARWVQSYPGWGGGVVVPGELCQQTGSLGLFSKGIQVMDVRQDVLGRRQERCRHSFVLRFCAPAYASDGFSAMVDFQHWVQEQNALGLAPRFGDMPENSAIYAQNGRLERTDGAHTATYAVELSADYMKLYEVK